MRVLFLTDKFSHEHRSAESRHPGGAELTDAAALEACPFPLTVSSFKELALEQLDAHDVLLLGNSQSATPQQLAAVARSGRHILFEHDLRICRLNGNFPSAIDPVHRLWERCWCPHDGLQEIVRSARGMIFLTRRQLEHYRANPFFRFAEARMRVLGCSLFSRQFFEQLPTPAEANQTRRHGSCALHSKSFIKGTREALQYIAERGWEPRLLKDLPPEDVLATFREAERLVYLPRGLEPAGRMPVEARLNGCEVVVNDHVGVAGERWWQGDREQALGHLTAAPAAFWRFVEELNGAGPVGDDAWQAGPQERAAAALSRGFAALGTRQAPRLPLLGAARKYQRSCVIYPGW
ncbi:MAG: hypothetical protein R3B07_22490 [Polyangiaceae bacterium]